MATAPATLLGIKGILYSIYLRVKLIVCLLTLECKLHKDDLEIYLRDRDRAVNAVSGGDRDSNVILNHKLCLVAISPGETDTS